MDRIKQAVILAGGLGTRLRPFTDHAPKPMVPVQGRPFLEYLLDQLKEQGIADLVLLLGYLPKKITAHFGDGSKFGLTIRYSISDISDDTGTRIKKALNLIDDTFMLLYADNYWPLNLKKMTEFFQAQQTNASVTVYTNKSGITKNNIRVDDRGYVVEYDKSRTAKNLNGVEIGYCLLRKQALDDLPEHNFSFEADVLPRLVAAKQLSGYCTDHRYYSISTPEKVSVTESFFAPKKIIFLDRDGVINKKAPKADYVKRWAEFEFLPGAIEALQQLQQHGYELIIISNQAGVARKMMTEEDLETIHHHMKQTLAEQGVTVRAIYHCPHGWNDSCGCRKPKPGMFFQAAHDHAIDLTKTIFIGDDERDQAAGDAAGCQTLLVTSDRDLLSIVRNIVTNQPL
ncbi:MAG: hypothetical protein A3J59_03390 [Candidatus Buchananbacteria bacterium RIFCSPHIGHO2_02_FULL_56_16]|uniref:D,D-heptose 1,7-bisphosphate phosphatase n=1 Tax=Candidatus Buchananbacteria bacterium RIFCSPHIGHO2_02_FULL_56_16 TaxID=1797542 RepID=A0A1G1YKH2_9BACT|nr:MAG: hypothetical protein A3J59_03390 [Candidatus Buchananbacteria bacterium RIFCSPHIGHO2_02_FULL_56_16]